MLLLCLGKVFLVLVLIRLLRADGLLLLLRSSRICGSHLGGRGSREFSHCDDQLESRIQSVECDSRAKVEREDRAREMEIVKS